MWVSKPIYESLPYFYLLVGALTLGASMYLNHWYWPTICFVVGLGCLVAGLVMTTYFVAGGLLSSAWVNLVQLVVLFAGFLSWGWTPAMPARARYGRRVLPRPIVEQRVQGLRAASSVIARRHERNRTEGRRGCESACDCPFRIRLTYTCIRNRSANPAERLLNPKQLPYQADERALDSIAYRPAW